MFSLKTIEKKVSRGKKKASNDISPHPNKKMKINHDFNIEEIPVTKNKSKKSKKLDMKKKTDVCHPKKNMRVNMDSFLASNKNKNDEVSTNNSSQEDSSKAKKKLNDRYFVISRTTKHTINHEDNHSEEEKQTYIKLSDDHFSNNNNIDNNGSLQNTENEDIETIGDIKNERNEQKKCITPVIGPVLLKRKEYSNTSDISSSSEESSDDESDWCPWKSFNCSQEEEMIQSTIKTPETKKSSHKKKIKFLPQSAYEKKEIVGWCERVYKINESSLLVILRPGNSFYLHGVVDVCLVAGSAQIFGYSLKKQETVTMYSASCYSLLSIDAINGENIRSSKYSYINNYKFVKERDDASQESSVVAVKLSRNTNTLPQFIHSVGFRNLFPVEKNKSELWLSSLGIVPIYPVLEQTKKFGLYAQSRSSQQCIKDINKISLNNKGAKIMLCGGKGVGKSSLMKVLINTMLSNCKSSGGVYCLDIDPGQPEMSLPGTMSLTYVTKPLIGHSFTHFQNTEGIEYIKHIFLGCISVQNILFQYLDAVKYLYNIFTELEVTAPLVVNTMGWTRDIGFDIIVQILNIIQPNNVIELKSEIKGRNFHNNLDCASVSESSGSILGSQSSVILNYQHSVVSSEICKMDNNRDIAQAKDKRDLRFVVYFSGLWEQKILKPVVKVPWKTVGIHVAGDLNISNSHILLTLNASLVSLCRVNENLLVNLSEDLFKILPHDALYKSPPECLGWAIVRGIDPKAKSLHILTPMSKTDVLDKVNCIIMCEIALPEKITSIFHKDNSPYCQVGDRTGAAKLVSGRKAKVAGNR